METILIWGIESVVGANLALAWSERHRVVGLSSLGPVPLDGCETGTCDGESMAAVRDAVASVAPDRIVYCGPESDSCWQSAATRPARRPSSRTLENWIAATRESGRPFTFLSSDAVFTGPRLFHSEDCDGYCTSPAAAAVRLAERLVADELPAALICRTHAFGWSPAASGSRSSGWIESLLAQLERGQAGPFDTRRHASPLLATHLAVLVERAHQEGLAGLVHVAGAERVSLARFVERLSDTFELPMPRRTAIDPAGDRPVGFGLGETSLDTRRIRLALCAPIPTLAEGLDGLHRQAVDGWKDRLQEPAGQRHERVA